MKKTTKFYNIKHKKYKNDKSSIAIYSEPIPYGFSVSRGLGFTKTTTDNEKNNIDKDHSINSSISRTKSKIYDLANSNDWEYFITLTFNKEKVDRYNYFEVSKKLSKLLNNITTRISPNLKYLIVPELHKDGAIHFHGLLANTDGLTFIDSQKVDLKNNIIYNIKNFNLGFTTATKVQDTEKVSYYILKYITKGLIEKSPNKKRYWNSKNLEKPIISYNFIKEKEMSDNISYYVKNYKSPVIKEIFLENSHIQTIMYFYN